MRRLLVICLLCIHFFGNTEMNLLLSVPQLISHFFQHSRQTPGLSFFTFLNMHYGGDDGTSADDHEDNKLPYHNPHQSHSFNTVISSIPNTEIPGFDIEEITIEYSSLLPASNPSEHVLILLQPPRLA